jgi:PAS domain S-box-containing protein
MNSPGVSLEVGLPLIAIVVFIYFLVRSERKKQDENFHYIAESIPQMLWSTNERGESKYFNSKWFEYFGLVQGKNHKLNWKQYVHPDDLERVTTRWTRAMKEKRPYENEYRLRGKDGQYRWFLSRGIPIQDQNQDIIKWIGTATDIHQNKEALRARDELLALLDQEISARRVQQTELERAIKTRDEFMSMASHELKTPLTSLQLQTQMSKKIIAKEGLDAFPPEKLIKLIQTFDNQVGRLSRLVEDMLDVVKINQGCIPINLETANLGELVTGSVEKFNTTLNRVNGNDISVSSNGMVEGNFDRFRIEQVVFNLLSNATKYGEGAPVKVEVIAENNRAKILVHDKGPGIALENQERIFKPFERATSSRQISGLGLGLHIVSRIVAAHGGDVRVESALGHGATFIVELPTAFECQPHLSAVSQGLKSL